MTTDMIDSFQWLKFILVLKFSEEVQTLFHIPQTLCMLME